MNGRTGIMGGTFNPVHMGHLLLAERAREQAGLDKVIFMPSGQSYMKQGISVLDGQTRLELIRLSIAGNPYFSASDMEIARSGYTYTHETLWQLSIENPGTEYYFITGADCLFSIENWKEPGRILSLCTLMTAVRGDADIRRTQTQAERLRKRYGARIILVDTPRMDISSTEIRERLKAGKSIRYMVAEKAEQYIYEKQLFLRRSDKNEAGGQGQ